MLKQETLHYGKRLEYINYVYSYGRVTEIER